MWTPRMVGAYLSGGNHTRLGAVTSRRGPSSFGDVRSASLCPILPIGADGLAEQDHYSRVGACAHRLGDATAGSALDCDLGR
jgi:hypothetical protein